MRSRDHSFQAAATPRRCSCFTCTLACPFLQAGGNRTYPTSADPNYIGACLAAGGEQLTQPGGEGRGLQAPTFSQVHQVYCPLLQHAVSRGSVPGPKHPWLPPSATSCPTRPDPPADEHRDIGDWVRYHLELGFGTVYIYDTGRTSMADKLQEEGLAQVWWACTGRMPEKGGEGVLGVCACWGGNGVGAEWQRRRVTPEIWGAGVRSVSGSRVWVAISPCLDHPWPCSTRR